MKRLTFAGLIALTVALAPVARAADNSWTNSASGKWEDAAGWTQGAPSLSDGATLITNAGPKTVTIDATTAGSFPATMTVSNLTLFSPAGPTNTLLLSNSGTNVPLRVLNALGVSNCLLWATNSALEVLGGSWTNYGNVTVIDGILTVTNGVTYIGTENSTGQLTLSNSVMAASSIFMAVFSNYMGIDPDASKNRLTIFGGKVSLAFDLTLVWGGSVWITDGQLVATNGTITLGAQRSSQMTVSNATVFAKAIHVGIDSTLTIAGGSVALLSDFEIGDLNDANVWVAGGQLVVTNGVITCNRGYETRMTLLDGSLLAGDIYIGGEHESGSQHELTVAGGTASIYTVIIGDIRGSGRMTISGGTVSMRSLELGPASSGALVISGGDANVDSDITIGSDDCYGSGYLWVDGGNLSVTNSLGNATLEVRSGTLTLNCGTLQVDNLMITNPCGLFVRNGGTLIVSNLVLTANLDADGDGVANGWEQASGLDPLNAADASADNDGDGFANLQEFQAGTNPTNASSMFRVLSLESTNNDMLVTWLAGGGRTNVVQSAPDLTGSYSNVSPNIILPGSGDVTTNYLDTGAATNGNKFYKIRLVP